MIPTAIASPLPTTRDERVVWGPAAPALVFVGCFAFLMLVAPKLLGDPDSHWHVAVGAWIWAHGAVPWIDPFSHTFAGHPWIAKEWLSQLIMFAAERAGGWAGLVALTASALSLLFCLLYAWLAARCRALLALTLTLLAAVFLAPHFLARPHVLAFLPLFFWARGLVEALDEGRAPSPWLYVVVALWANLHGSVTIAYPIAALLALEAIGRAPAGRRIQTIVDWAIFGALALAAGCVTPYGIHSLLVTFTLFGSGEPLPFITEWRPIGWTLPGFLACGAAVLFALGLVADGWRNAARIALLGMLTAMLVRHSRFVDVFAIVAPLLVAVPLARRFPGLAPDGAGSPTSWKAWPMAARLVIAVAAIGSLAALTLRTHVPDPAVTPRAALSAAREAGVIGGRVYNAYDFGGYLIAEGIPTFIDGRTDQLFLGGFISGLLTAADAPDPGPFLAQLDRYGATWAIVRSGTRDASHLEQAPGWTRIHRDETASVYAHRLRGSLP